MGPIPVCFSKPFFTLSFPFEILVKTLPSVSFILRCNSVIFLPFFLVNAAVCCCEINRRREQFLQRFATKRMPNVSPQKAINI